MAIAYVSGIGAATKQTKTVEITTNGTHEIKPSFRCVLDKVIVNTNVPSVDTIEPMLDEIIAIQESLIPPTFAVKHTTTQEITTFEFKKGITWAEWCDSEHNTADYFCSGDYVYGGNLSAYIYDDYGNGIMARPEDAIVADREYYLTQW